MLVGTFLLSLLSLGSSAPATPTTSTSRGPPRCQPVHGQCEDLAINFIREVADLEECREKCSIQEGCQFYSYHSSTGTHHRHCYLYTSCNTLRYSQAGSHWVTGSSKYHSDCFTAPFIVAVHNLLRPT